MTNTLEGWIEEVRADEEWRDKHLEKQSELIERYHGSGWGGGGSVRDNPRNHAYQMVSLYMPLLASDIPTARVRSARTQSAPRATAGHHGMNRWLRDTRHNRLTAELGMDFMFSHGGTVLRAVPVPWQSDHEDPYYWPSLTRLAPHMWGWDRLAHSFDAKRYSWHVSVSDHDLLIEQAKADRDLPEESREGWIVSGVKAMASNLLPKKHSEEQRHRIGQVAWYELWIRDVKVDEKLTRDKGYNGVILRFAYGAGEDDVFEVCEPRDWFGPPQGPHALWGCYTVPNSSMPLGPIAANYGAQRELNLISRANNRSARSWTRGIFTNDPLLAHDIKNSQHDTVFVHPELTEEEVIVREWGGLADQSVAQEQRLQDMLDRDSGITEAMRGVVVGAATAYENSIAASSASSRQGYIVRRFYEANEEALRGVLWMQLNDDEVLTPLGPEGAEETGYMNVRGGPEVEELEDLELTLEAGSMGRRSPQEQEQRAAGLLAMVGTVSQLVMQFPFIDAGTLIDVLAKESGFQELQDIFDAEMAQELSGALMGQQGTAPQPAGQPRERLGRTLGPAFRADMGGRQRGGNGRAGGPVTGALGRMEQRGVR